MAYPPISNLPSPPSRQDPANFADEADAFLGALPTFQTEVNASGTYIDGKAAEVDVDSAAAATSASNAATSATNAANSATAAANSAGSAGGVLWVSGTSYAIGFVVYSPIDYKNYRAITNHSAVITDPSLDETNWTSLSGAASLSDFGVTASATELNYVEGVTSNIQTQLNNISVTSGSLTKSFISGEIASITLSSAISPAPVVSATREVSQAGVSSKGAWDVATDGSNYERQDTAYDTTLSFETIPLDITKALYSGNSFSGASYNSSSPSGIAFSSDGTKVYVTSTISDAVTQINLSTPFDISTITSRSSFSVSGQNGQPSGVAFSADGTKMFVSGEIGSFVYQYTLSTAWVVTSASYDGLSLSVGGVVGQVKDVAISTDGTKLFVVGIGTALVAEYTLSTPFSLSGATYSGNSLSVPEKGGLTFYQNGSKLVVCENGTVRAYSLSTPFDITTSTGSVSITFNPGADSERFSGVAFSPSAGTFVLADGNNGAVYQFDMTLVEALQLGVGSFVQSDVGKQVEGNGGKAVLISSGGRYNIIAPFNNTDTIAAGDWALVSLSFDSENGVELTSGNPYDLLQAVLGSTASFLNIGTTNVTSIRMKPDGTRFFAADASSAVYRQYNLSTPYDISTAVAAGTYNSSQAAYGFDFKPDGTSFYGLVSGFLRQYNLSNAWDISTAAAGGAFDFVSSIPNPQYALLFKPDGSSYFVGNSAGQLQQFNMSTAWNVSTSANGGTVETALGNISDLGWNDDGSKLFVFNSDGIIKDFSVDGSPYDLLGGITQITSEDLFAGNAFGGTFIQAGSKVLLSNFSDDIFAYSTQAVPTGEYHPAITNAGGQIDTTFWLDINNMTADQAANDGSVFYAVSTDDRTTWSVIKDADGVRPIVRLSGGAWEYNSNATYGSETWAAATTNEEIYALQEALTEVAQNRMDKTQLEAVTDPNHYTLDDSLDLMIALYLPSGGTSPASDGVSINYDAEAINRGAILGTDYDYDFPNSTTVRITSNATQNLKIRVV